ncbi:pheromone-regulated protein PRM10 LALA0_S01e01970g [Lachancea lanzarotensis]|uniref:Pheromone-regulated membrane protein 10 n=1 Tax=Lachancea lanzarotensis TaxID=1245769 RepID=A0A0C7MX86_9SACH|nr:uncharacterized protein LALA0_S01e01970g [Lachancea lanzarotensis]CEP60055.1 LALA0S01e01970g1_1 [Lachancea lanzarotensis]
MSDQRPRPGARKSSSERFQFLKPRSSSRNRSARQSTASNSDSDSDDDNNNSNGGQTRPPHERPASRNLPSFARGLSSQQQNRRQDIEDDAIDTIQTNSGNNSDHYDEESEEQEFEANKDIHSNDRNPSETHSYHEQNSYNPQQLHYMSSDDEKIDPKDSDKSSPTQVATTESQNPFNNPVLHGEGDKGNNDDDKGSSDEDKVDNFKRFFRRRSSSRRSSTRRSSHDSRPSGMRSLKEENEDDDQGGFLNKFLQYTGGGMTPGLVRSGTQRSSHDNEHVAGQENLEEPVDGVDVSEAAQQILQQHGAAALQDPNAPKLGAQGNGSANLEVPMNNPSDGETMVTSGKDSFFANRVGHYDDFDDDPDGFNPLMEDNSYIAPPDRVRGGVLGSLLKLYQNEDEFASRSQVSLDTTPESVDFYDNDSLPLTGMTEVDPGQPNKKGKKISFNTPSFSGIKGKASNLLSSENLPNNGKLPNFKATRPKAKNFKQVAKQANKLRRKQNAEAKITVHIAALLQRQRFILRLCKALMLYGAPTHRLEEYMVMTSRVLEIDGQFLYVPGCMVVSFGDATTRTSEVQLVRCAQGLNLWKLHQVHAIYKQVVHDLMSAEEANMAIDRILKEKNLYPPWACVFLYGFCSSMVTPFAFGGDWINMATSFVIGCCVGCLQFIVSQRSSLYSNVFEVTASIVVSFCGRALGSIPKTKHINICFGSTVQGSLALILPGFIILSGSLELQSRNLVAGSVRMFYAIIYSLFLGFGITLGAALFGWLYHDATNDTVCQNPHVPTEFKILFVPAFSIGLALINQARWSQLPVMTFISCAGYAVTWGCGLHFKNSTEFNSSISAFVIGVLGNLYSRIWKGLAVSAMLPGIFVQVPSGVASQSSLLAGVQSANAITNSTNSAENAAAVNDISGSMSFGVTMIQVSIGISVGLFASTLFVYPFGKKSTSLFTL